MIAEGEQRATPSSPPRFVADAMLGRLAKWLRMLGYDVVFMPDVPDIDILRRARAESRFLLTRDTALARRARSLGVFIHHQDLKAQLRELAEKGLISGPLPDTRCPICNVPLQAVPKPHVRDRVPPYVFQTQREFYECPQCHRIYWAGTHWQNVQATWKEIGW
ncbi:MAG: hypothetical protein GXO55_01085 [Chloroflexi bacterium]|nr:hypothetical protein [Chloroflexota bacterium]